MAQFDPLSSSILVATPTAVFGDAILHSLEEIGCKGARLASSAEEALSATDSEAYTVAILDSELSEDPQVLALDLHLKNPSLKLVLVPPENDPNHPAVAGIPCVAYLQKPLYLPNLLSIMNQLSAAPAPDPEEDKEDETWVNPAPEQEPPAEDAPALFNRDAFEELLSTTSAAAAAVAWRGGRLILAGALPQGAETGLASVVERYWQREERSDLVRFSRLESIHGPVDCLIYLTCLLESDDSAAALLYPINTPLSKVRAQAGPLILSLRKLMTPLTAPQKPPVVEAKQAQLDAVESSPPPPPDGSDWQEEVEELPEFNLTELLGTIPSPDPKDGPPAAGSGYNGWVPETDLQPENAYIPPESGEAEKAAWDWTLGNNGPGRNDELQAENRLPWEEDDYRPDYSPGKAPSPDKDDPFLGALTIAPKTSEDEEADASGEHGSVLTALTSLEQLEPATAGLSLINYTCVLIPRIPQHYLTGSLGERLGQWVQQLCLAFGWRLEGIALRPQYLQWTVQVTPAISPGNVVKIVRQRTSEQIFASFEDLRQQNPSGDFWAVGYLIISGSQPPSANLLREYIQQTRRRQGALQPPGGSLPRLNS